MQRFFSFNRAIAPLFSMQTLRFSWPLWIMGACFYVVYVAMTLPLEQEYHSMLMAKKHLLEEKDSLELVIKDLEKRIQHHEDPRWQEMVLTRQLNLAQTGWRKWIGKERP